MQNLILEKIRQEEDIFIYNLNDEDSLKRMEKITGTKLGVTVTEKGLDKAVCYTDGKNVVYRGKVIAENEKLSLKGKHNLENTLFIVTAAEQVGVDEEIIREFLYHTKSLEHRMERFWQWKNVLFVNDSKGTNLDIYKLRNRCI